MLWRVAGVSHPPPRFETFSLQQLGHGRVALRYFIRLGGLSPCATSSSCATDLTANQNCELPKSSVEGC